MLGFTAFYPTYLKVFLSFFGVIVMLSADTLSFQEFMNRESWPLATLHGAVFEFLRDREDTVVFGAQAVNAYVDEPRMTQDIDLMFLR